MIRIVKLTIATENVQAFQDIFENAKENVRNFEGCTRLELLRDRNNRNVFFTYSYWKEEKYLESYRDSDLFMSYWKQLKPLFSAKAEAWSVDSEVVLD